MHREHEKVLKDIFKIRNEPKMTFTQRLTDLVEKAEERATHYFGRHQSFSAHELTILTIDLSRDEAVCPIAVIPSDREDYSKMDKDQLLSLCIKRADKDPEFDVPSGASLKVMRTLLSENDEKRAAQ